jgi:hypothetical protein
MNATQEKTRKKDPLLESDPTKTDHNAPAESETSLGAESAPDERPSTQEKTQMKDTPPESDPTKTDRNAPAGSETSLGAESVRDGRPSTDDSVVEAMDEETPGLVRN